MRKSLLALLCAAALLLSLTGCGAASAPETTAAPETTEAPTAAPETAAPETEAPEAEAVGTEPAETEPAAPALADGIYTAIFDTDSSMFHVNETLNKQGILTVQDGAMTIHVTLASTSILNLFPGTAEDAQKDGAELLQPSEDEVFYSDGTTEIVYGFDIPVPCLDDEFDCALIGKKGKWYDHKVSVSNPQPYVPAFEGEATIEVIFAGGSGKAHVESPCTITCEDGVFYATVVWSSPNYTYMLVDDVKYEPIQEEGNSTFRIPVLLNTEMAVSAETVAMSTPHLIDYTLFFDSTTLILP